MRSFALRAAVLVATLAMACAAPVDYEGGLAALTEPAVNGVIDPLTTGVGRGVAGAAGGTQQTSDLLGDAVAELFHVLEALQQMPNRAPEWLLRTLRLRSRHCRSSGEQPRHRGGCSQGCDWW
ncbi:hypothetical protein BKA62DRAFT_803800 [Auriculariales sp. MPI-PUGE-AT-0066]|nr:hypothetical protein BKA62DRAFT_803800 [Auriculariales sp. MPI-PUGE-AT-0066]